ncbi:MAG: WD40 repeat domain-containing protein [Pirellulaceae bacterium]
MSTITLRGWLGCLLSLIASALMSIASTARAQIGEPRALIGHTRGINDIAFSADGESLISASYDHTARIWRLKDVSEMAVLEHEGNVRFAVFAPESRVLTISEIKEAEAEVRKPVRGPGAALTRCRWSVFQWPAAEASPRLLGQGDLGDVLSVAVLANNAFLVDQLVEVRTNTRRVEATRRVEIRGLPDGDERFSKVLTPYERSFQGGSAEDRHCVALGATGQWAYADPGRRGDTVVILDAAGQQLFALPNADTAVDRLFASREGDLLGAVVSTRFVSRATTQAVGIRIWNPVMGTMAMQSPLLFGRVCDVQFMADRRLGLVAGRSPRAGDYPGNVTLFQGVSVLDPVSGQLTPVIADESPTIGTGPGIQLLDRAGVGDANRIAFGVPPRELLGVVAWNNPAGVVWLPFSAQQQYAISRLAFSPYERYLVAGCDPPDLNAGIGDEQWRTRLLCVWPLTTDGSVSSSNR